ncbi:MAG: hypothetical protein U0R24_11380 [Solirubrobacterales bacterium]
MAIVLATIAVLAPSAATAAPGDRDPSWGQRGIARPPAGFVFDVDATPDGGAVYIARPDGNAESPLEVLKLTATGASDPDFGTGGLADLPAGFAASAVDVAPEGQILLAGHANGSPGRLAAARLLPDGAVDPSFGTGGLATANLPGQSPSAAAILAASGGGAAIAITADDPSTTPYDPQMGVLRFTAEGDPDPDFGTGGFSDLIPGRASQIADAGSGRYLLGNSFDYAVEPTVARVAPSGALDTSFGQAGSATLPQPQFGLYSGSVNGLAVDDSGRVVVEYSAYDLASTKGGSYAKLLRLDSVGAVDESFDPSAILAPSQKQHRVFSPVDVAIDDSGRVIVAGTWSTTLYTGSAYEPAAARLLEDGSPDPSFGEHGLAITPALELGGGAISMHELTLEPGGEILGVAAGYGGDWEPYFIRLLAQPGRADADADGVTDRHDGCPLVTGKRKRGGCPLLARKLAISYDAEGDLLEGTVTALGGCVKSTRLSILRATRGRDETVARIRRTNRGTWSVSGPFEPGRYYAAAKRVRNGTVGICRAAHSRKIEVGK